MVLDIGLDLLPIAFIIPDLFAMRTYRQQAAELFDIGQSIFQLTDQSLVLDFARFAPGDVTGDGYGERFIFYRKDA